MRYYIYDSRGKLRCVCNSYEDAVNTTVSIRKDDIESGYFLDYTIKEVRV